MFRINETVAVATGTIGSIMLLRKAEVSPKSILHPGTQLEFHESPQDHVKEIIAEKSTSNPLLSITKIGAFMAY